MNNILKILTIFSVSGFLQNCSENPETLEAKKEQLTSYQEQVSTLESKIKNLRQEIDQLDTGNSNSEEGSGQLVRLTPVKQRHFQQFVEVRGDAVSKKNVRVAGTRTGRIEKIYYEEGDQVEKGALIAEQDNETLRNNIEEIKTNLEHAKTVYQKRKNLWEKNIGSELDYLNAKNQKQNLEKQLASARSQLEDTRIKAPVKGEIDEVFLNEGEMAGPTSPICRILNIEAMRLETDVSEAYLGAIQTGDTVQIDFPSINLTRREPVTHVGQFIQPDSRTFQIEISLDNPNKQIKPNMLSVIRFRNYSNPDALVIPTQLIQESDEGQFVFKAREENNGLIAQKTVIETGRTYQGFTEVKNGLQKNDQLIKEGFREVSDQEKIYTPEQ